MAKGGFSGGYGGGRRGGMPGGGMNANMLKQAQKMQQDMMRIQAEVEEKEFSASAGGGMVTAVVNGKKELVRLEMDESAVIEAEGEEDVEMLSDAIVAAVNEALKKADDAMSSSVAQITGGLGLGF